MIINKETEQFIQDNLNEDIRSLRLKKHFPSNVDIELAINQIDGRKRALSKLPAFVENRQFIFPPKLSVEQSSSETTARYKAQLIGEKDVIDLTGGFGIDTIFFAESAENVVYIEQNQELVDIAKHNFEILKKENINCIHDDAISFLSKNKQKYDWIFIDPARRDKHRNKVFLLKDCEPDVVKHLNLLLSKAKNILIKTSPMLDISTAMNDLSHFVSDIHILSVKNECKELLFICRKSTVTNPLIHCLNFTSKQKYNFTFYRDEESKANAVFTEKVYTYLYEPNASLLKAGAFNLLAKRFDLLKLHVNTHLYTGDCYLADFPGRIFKVNEVVTTNFSSIKNILPENKANITCRNFPLSVEQFRKKYKIKDGGSLYLFATTFGSNKKAIICCEKIPN